ncbi:MAG: phytoene/squalene synthase family protein [Kordiimonas sp.]
MQKSEENAEYCLNLVRSGDPDRYLLSLFAPQKAHRNLWALYAFNQEVAKIRETVSEPMLGEIRIQWWQDVLREITEGNVREQPIIIELAKLLQEHTSIEGDLHELLTARKNELAGEGSANFNSLKSYAFQVGGTLYCAASKIIHSNLTLEAQDTAKKLGAAWAMLGLVRALPHSWQTNAAPRTDEMRPGLQSQDAVDANALLQPIVSKMLEFTEEQAELAKQNKIVKSERSILLLATQLNLYQKNLQAVGNNPFELVNAEPSQLRKLSSLFWANLTKRF